jgi:hypothetical protein
MKPLLVGQRQAESVSRSSAVELSFRMTVLCAVAIAAYANSFHAGFAFDSRQLILQDTRVHASTAENVDLILHHTYWWPYGESGLYRPATTLSYLLNYAIVGSADRPPSYHAFNLLVHIANVLLLWALVRRVTRREDAALAAAAVWAVLPVSVEAVTNIVGRADLLAALGVLGAVLLYAQARDARGWRRTVYLIAVGACTLVAVFSKESGIVVAPIVVLFELADWRPRSSVRMLAFAAVAVAPPLALMWAQRSAVLAGSLGAEFPFTDNPIVGASFLVGRLTALAVMGRYVWLVVWPAKLSSDYSFAQLSLASGSAADWAAWATVAGLGLALVVLARRDRAALLFGGFALLAYLPASNLLFASGTIMAERLVYLPSAGLAALAMLALFGAAAVRPRAVAFAIAGAIVVAFSVRTARRNRDWHDDVTLWRAAAADTPMSAKAHSALAEALYDSDPAHGNLAAVIDEAERGVAILDALSDAENSVHTYRQAAAYYLDEAHTHDRAGVGDPQQPADDVRRAYARAMTLAERCVRVVSAQAPKVPGGSREPEADAYRLLSAARLGLRDGRQALDAAMRARAAAPLNPLGYQLSASARVLAQDADGAVVDLMTGSILSGDSGLNDAAIALYGDGVDDQHCAVVMEGGRPALNLQCPIVVRHTCAAIADAIAIDRQLGRTDAAEQLSSTAQSTFRCTRVTAE